MRIDDYISHLNWWQTFSCHNIHIFYIHYFSVCSVGKVLWTPAILWVMSTDDTGRYRFLSLDYFNGNAFLHKQSVHPWVCQFILYSFCLFACYNYPIYLKVDDFWNWHKLESVESLWLLPKSQYIHFKFVGLFLLF